MADVVRCADWALIAAAKKPESVERALQWAERVLPGVWADRVSRTCLFVAVASLWLSITLGFPLLLVFLVGACVGIWMRRDKRAASEAELSDPDFF
jgi:hypothetical protein